MSYPLDVDEMRLSRLLLELRHRFVMVLHGRCSYCSKKWGTSPCKLSERHDPKRAYRYWKAERERLARITRSGKMGMGPTD